MKNLIASSIVLFTMSSFCVAKGTAPAAPVAPAASVQQEVKKMDIKTAKKECKKDNLKGKAFAECVKNKTM